MSALSDAWDALHEARDVIDDAWYDTFDDDVDEEFDPDADPEYEPDETFEEEFVTEYVADGFDGDDLRHADDSGYQDSEIEEMYQEIVLVYNEWIGMVQAFPDYAHHPLLCAWVSVLDAELLLIQVGLESEQERGPVIASNLDPATERIEEAWRLLARCIDHPISFTDSDDRPFILLERLRGTTHALVEMSQQFYADRIPEDRITDSLYRRFKDAIPGTYVLQGCLLADAAYTLSTVLETCETAEVHRRATNAHKLARGEARVLLDNAMQSRGDDAEARIFAGLERAELDASDDVFAAMKILGAMTKAVNAMSDPDPGLRIKQFTAEQVMVTYFESPDVVAVAENIPSLMGDAPETASENLACLTVFYVEATSRTRDGLSRHALPFYERAHLHALLEGDDTWIAVTSEKLSAALADAAATDTARGVPELSSEHPTVVSDADRSGIFDPDTSVFEPIDHALEMARDIALGGALASERLGDHFGTFQAINHATRYSITALDEHNLRKEDLLGIELIAQEFQTSTWAALVHAHLSDLHAAIGQSASATEWRKQAFAEFFAGNTNTIQLAMRECIDAGWNPAPIERYSNFVNDWDATFRDTERFPVGSAHSDMLASAWCATIAEVCADELNAAPGHEAQLRANAGDGAADRELIYALIAQTAMLNARVLEKVDRRDLMLLELHIARDAARIAGDPIGEVHAKVLIEREIGRGRDTGRRLEPDH